MVNLLEGRRCCLCCHAQSNTPVICKIPTHGAACRHTSQLKRHWYQILCCLRHDELAYLRTAGEGHLYQQGMTQLGGQGMILPPDALSLSLHTILEDRVCTSPLKFMQWQKTKAVMLPTQTCSRRRVQHWRALSIPGCFARAAPATAPSPGMMLMTPGGMPA